MSVAYKYEIPAEDEVEIVEMLREIYDEQDNFRDLYGSWPTQYMEAA
jgi:hypothetical protein